MNGPSYDLLVVLHVLSAVVGFGAVGATGTYAARLRGARDPLAEPSLRRYFHPGTNWAERSLLATPVFGAALLFGGDRSALSQPWPWIGLGSWSVAAVVAVVLCWPAEKALQNWFVSAANRAASPAVETLRDECRKVQAAALFISVCFVVAVVVMIWQPT